MTLKGGKSPRKKRLVKRRKIDKTHEENDIKTIELSGITKTLKDSKITPNYYNNSSYDTSPGRTSESSILSIPYLGSRPDNSSSDIASSSASTDSDSDTRDASEEDNNSEKTTDDDDESDDDKSSVETTDNDESDDDKSEETTDDDESDDDKSKETTDDDESDDDKSKESDNESSGENESAVSGNKKINEDDLHLISYDTPRSMDTNYMYDSSEASL